MARSTPYKRAPITEAVIDIGFGCADGNAPSVEQIEEFCQSERASYSRHRQIVSMKAELSFESPEFQQQAIGRAIRTDDSTYILQLRANEFTFSRLPPYESWEPFRDEAKRLWTKFREAASPVEITRVAVRYINRFNIPIQQSELKEYFRFYAEYPKDLPQTMLDFSTRVTLPLEDISGAVTLTQSLLPPEQPSFAPVLLDLDVYRSTEVPQSERELWEYFEVLRNKKNELFEACLLEPARELIR